MLLIHLKSVNMAWQGNVEKPCSMLDKNLNTKWEEVKRVLRMAMPIGKNGRQAACEEVLSG